MTFMVNQDGKVLQKDLGPDTQAKANAIQRFVPGKGWSPASP
jgi:predicted cupin superfamily sugar epimerase